MKGQEKNSYMIADKVQCKIDMYQDTEELNLWERMNGKKDTIYINSDILALIDRSKALTSTPSPSLEPLVKSKGTIAWDIWTKEKIENCNVFTKFQTFIT